ncbi:MAG: S-layer homology domain-containing protein [Symbiobacteriia bacterium]
MTLKKALVAITVVAMLFGMVSTAFAGGFTDVTDSNVAAAAARLNALSIMQGFPDGSFGATQTITRAQFAAVAVRALGLDNAATYAKGLTKFSDVAADHWASGYVNIASQQGIIAGFPDGTFHPEDPVTYAQALTIVVRMLGYSPVTEGKGTWPSNYIVRAAMIGFTSGVSFAAGDPASRGNVARFVDNSLTADLMVNTGVVGSADTYEIKAGMNLLNTYLGATETSGQLTSSPDLLGVSGITVKVSATVSNDLVLADGVSAAGLLGHDVNAWSKGGKVVLVEDAEAATDSKSGSIAAYTPGTSIKIGTTTYDIAAAPFIAKNGVAPAGVAPAAGDSVAAVLDSNGDVKSIVAYAYSTSIVDAVDVDGKVITDADSHAFDFQTGTSTLTLNGKAATVADIQADDVIQWYGSPAGNKVVVVTRSTKTGALTRVNADGSVVVGGVTYDVNGYVTADLTLLAGDDVNISLDKSGDIAAIAAVSAAAATEIYAVPTVDTFSVGTTDGVAYYFKAFRADGTSATLKMASKVNFEGAANTVPSANMFGLAGTTKQVITYTVDSTGAVDSVTAVADNNPAPGIVNLDSVNKLAGGKLVTSGTIILDLSDMTAPAAITSTTLFKDTVTSGTVVADTTVTARAAVVAIFGSAGAPTSPYAYLTDVFYAGGAWNVTTVDGTTYTISTGIHGDVVADAVYKLTLAGDNITAVAGQSDINAGVASFDHNAVLSFDSTNNILSYKYVDANGVKLNATTKYALFNADTTFVDATGTTAKAGTSALLTAGKSVSLYDFDGDNIVDMVVVH